LTFTPGAQATELVLQAGLVTSQNSTVTADLYYDMSSVTLSAEPFTSAFTPKTAAPASPALSVYMSMIGSGFVHGDVVPVNSTATGKAASPWTL